MNTKIADQRLQTAHEMTKFTEKIYDTIQEQDNKICDMKLDIQRFHPETTDTTSRRGNQNGGTTFIRWGRQECPSNVSVPVYIGTVGGSYFDHTGGAAEYVCLPPDPQWNANKHFQGPNWGYMYGAEYQEISNSILENLQVPCSVCLSTSYSTTIMIPGRNQCYPGWQEAYHGELASGNRQHAAASEYVCLDHQSVGIGRKTSLDGKLFYPVQAKCGSLPCPPYKDNTLLTCVVCLG